MSATFPLALGPLQELKKELKEVDHAPTGLAQPVGSASPDHLGSKVSEMGNGGGDHETGQGEMTQSPSPPATPTFEMPENVEPIPELMDPPNYQKDPSSTTYDETGDGGDDEVADLYLQQFFEPHFAFKTGFSASKGTSWQLEIT